MKETRAYGGPVITCRKRNNVCPIPGHVIYCKCQQESRVCYREHGKQLEYVSILVEWSKYWKHGQNHAYTGAKCTEFLSIRSVGEGEIELE